MLGQGFAGAYNCGVQVVEGHIEVAVDLSAWVGSWSVVVVVLLLLVVESKPWAVAAEPKVMMTLPDLLPEV